MSPGSGQRSRSTVAGRSTTRGGVAAAAPARPVRIDLGAAMADNPLAPVPGWGTELAESDGRDERGWAGSSAASAHGLGDLVDKAGAQLLVLRRSLDEAAASDRVVRQHLADLTQRLQQGQKFGAEFDRRLAESARAAMVLEKAATTLRGLEVVVDQLRSSHMQLEQRVQQRLSEQTEIFGARLMEVEAAFEKRLAQMQERCEAAIGQAALTSEQATSEIEGRLSAIQDHLDHRADAMVAQVDRHAAQAQARVSLILDGASDRLATMEDQAERLGGESRERLEGLCQQAIQLLGHDPRISVDLAGEPAPGSLAHAVQRAKELVQTVDDAGVRIGAVRSDAASTIERLETACREVSEVIERLQPAQNELREKIEQSIQQARASDETLRQTSAIQASATEESRVASAHLARQREDLEAIGSASAYHVGLAREAVAGLNMRIEMADSRLRELDRAMEQVTEQAGSLVALAKRVAGLVDQMKPAPEIEDEPGAETAQAA